MGMSLDAEIMYGMVLFDGEETLINVPWRKSGDDFEDWIVAQLGLEPLDYSTYPEERYDYHSGESYEAYSARMKELADAGGKRMDSKAYYAKKRELLTGAPVEEEWGGTDGFHSIILRLKASPKAYANHHPREFDPSGLVVDAEVDLHAKRWLAGFDVVWEPKWLLVPSYG